MKFFVWADFDLDGTGSLLVLKWAFPQVDITFRNTKISAFKEEFGSWLKTDGYAKYDRVFFLDLDVSKFADLMDHEKAIVIDHHKSHVENKAVYKKSKIVVEETTSNVLLMFKKFQQQLANLTPAQKKMILYINDYDSYKLEYKESLQMNYLFSDMQKGDHPTKVDRFIAEFKDGFKGFDQFQQNIINLYIRRVQKAIDTAEYFEGEHKIQGQFRHIKAAITDTAINDVCQHILDDGYDLAITFNPKTQTVSFRTKCEDLDVSKVAEKLCGGGGHRYAAGGKVSEAFVEFTKLLTKVE